MRVRNAKKLRMLLEPMLGSSKKAKWPKGTLPGDKRVAVTAGVGRHILQTPFSDDEIALMFKNDLARAAEAAGKYPWFDSLNTVYQGLVVALLFLEGPTGFRKLGLTKISLAGSASNVGLTIKNGNWGHEHPRWARTLAVMAETVKWPGDPVKRAVRGQKSPRGKRQPKSKDAGPKPAVMVKKRRAKGKNSEPTAVVKKRAPRRKRLMVGATAAAEKD